MHIVSWNVNGLPTTLKDAMTRYGSLTCFFRDILQADIVCFQEAKVQEEKMEQWMACVPEYESFWAFSTAKKGYSGVTTYVRDSLSPLNASADPLEEEEDESVAGICKEGRVLVTDHGSFSLVNVYAPNSGERPERGRLGFKLAFLRALRRKCDAMVRSGRHVVVVGDLNISHKDVDVFRQWRVSDIYCAEELEWLESLFEGGGYVDLFRQFRPDAVNVFSVWDQRTDARSRNEGQRIDYTICNKAFLGEVVSADILKISPKKWSDHASVDVILKDQPPLPPHPPAPLSSKLMRRFQEDSRQRKLTALFKRPGRTFCGTEEGSGKVQVADLEAREADGIGGNAELEPARWQSGGSRISGPIMMVNENLPAGSIAGCTGQVSPGDGLLGSELGDKDSVPARRSGGDGEGGGGVGSETNTVEPDGRQRCLLAPRILVEGGNGRDEGGLGGEDVGGRMGVVGVGANVDGSDAGKVGGEELVGERWDGGVERNRFDSTMHSEEAAKESRSVMGGDCGQVGSSGRISEMNIERSLEVGIASSQSSKGGRKLEQQFPLGRKKSRGGKVSDGRQRPISFFMTKPA